MSVLLLSFNLRIRATVQSGNSVTIESYTYDYEGNRTSKTVNESDTTYYCVDSNQVLTQVLFTTDGEGKEKAFFTRGDELLCMEQDGVVSYYVADGHGNVRALTDDNGAVTDTYSYDAYGNLIRKTGITKNDYRYCGEEYNALIGLYYLRARYMDPTTGTFISMDSYAGNGMEPITLHKYLYANANPVTYIDPTGYFSLAECSVVQSIQGILNGMHQIAWLTKIVKWANIMCTAYDVAMEIRAVMLGEATIGDVVVALVKGVAIGLLADGLCGTVLGIVLKPMMALFGLGSQVDQIQEAIEKGDPVEISVRVTQLLCMLFGLSSQCFTGDTLVATEDGLKPIEDVKAGELVWSEDTETGEKELRKVTSVSVTETVELVHVWVGKEEIKTTRNHPFYVEGQGWKAAGELVAGDVLKTENGDLAVVGCCSVERLDEPVRVWNLEVSDSHVYYVGSVGVLVHNKCEDHHIASDKSNASGYTKKYKSLFSLAGMDLQDPDNIIRLDNHHGAHTKLYKDFILEKITEAVDISKSQKENEISLRAMLEWLKQELKANPRMPYKDGADYYK